MGHDVKKAILFVCMGNICRSPAAEGVMRSLLEGTLESSIMVDSCGVGDWHVGREPDPRMRDVASRRGIILNGRAKQFEVSFFSRYHYIMCSDNEVLHCLYTLANTLEDKAKLKLMTHYSELYNGEDIPDPYYESDLAFERVLDMLEDCCKGVLNHIMEKKPDDSILRIDN